VAILSAVEIVNTMIPGTTDAAILCKMAERGQITGGLLDAPLAMARRRHQGYNLNPANTLWSKQYNVWSKSRAEKSR